MSPFVLQMREEPAVAADVVLAAEVASQAPGLQLAQLDDIELIHLLWDTHDRMRRLSDSEDYPEAQLAADEKKIIKRVLAQRSCCRVCAIEEPSSMATQVCAEVWKQRACPMCVSSVRPCPKEQRDSRTTALASLSWRAKYELTRANGRISRSFRSPYFMKGINACLAGWKPGPGKGARRTPDEVGIAFQFVRTQARVSREPTLTVESEAMLDAMAYLGWGCVYGQRRTIRARYDT